MPTKGVVKMWKKGIESSPHPTTLDPHITLVNVYVDLLVFTRIAGTS